MDFILTPQEIYELDTFTLQEKVQQLQHHPQKTFYLQILKLAKLELIDRLQTQEFGRLLANDEYKIDLDFNLPPIAPSKIKQPPAAMFNRKQIFTQMQSHLVPGKSFVTIGKPAVSHHYKPKNKPRSKQAEIPNKTKQFLKSKKCSFSKPKLKSSIQKNQNLLRASVAKGNNLHEKMIKISEVPPLKQETKIIIDSLSKQQFSLKDKLRKQVNEMNVDYRQNDVYEEMKIIKMSPLNLKEQEAKLLENQDKEQNKMTQNQEQLNRTNYEDEQKIKENIQQVEIKFQNKQKIEEIFKQSSQHFHQHQNILKDIVEEGQFMVGINNSRLDLQKKCDHILQFQIYSDPSKQENNISLTPNISEKYLTTPTNQSIGTYKNDQQSIFEKPLENQSLKKQSKQIKSKSLKNFTKKIIPTVRKQQQIHDRYFSNSRQTFTHTSGIDQQFRSSLYQNKVKNSISKIKHSKLEHIEKPINNLSPINSSVNSYHQIIPSFHKLFPHSKNLLVTLRVVQQNLNQHFIKDVNSRSIIDEVHRLSHQNDLTFKIIYESEKAKKHNQLFNIRLDSFYRRSGIMLDRIRNQLDQPEPHQMLFYRVVRTKQEVYDIVNSSFHRTKSWYELPHGLQLKNSWNLLWTWSRPQIDFSDLLYFQKVNHFLGNKQIARKDLLKKNIQKIQKLGNKIKQYFDIIPQTFLLPGENIPFIKQFRQNGLKNPKNYWILKPVGLSRGRGIQLINKLEDVVFSEPVVLQKYINNPLLIDGYKFDMRIYVLVSGINPLETFIYHEGFARISTQPYSLNEQDIDNKFIHLTNFSIQRQNIAAEKKSFQEEIGGSKISLKMLASKLKSMGIQWQTVLKSIQDIVLKSLIACMNVIPSNPNCFQLFGYDIFLDQNCKCWLLEVNSSPSLEKQFTLDQIIKQQLIDDIVQIVNPLNYDRQRLLEIVQRRRKEAEGLKSSINTGNNSIKQLNEDISYILRGQKMRKYGEAVENSNFKMIAPSDNYHRIIKTLQQYKIDPIVKGM